VGYDRSGDIGLEIPARFVEPRGHAAEVCGNETFDGTSKAEDLVRAMIQRSVCLPPFTSRVPRVFDDNKLRSVC
jgi:hypothetical protein